MTQHVQLADRRPNTDRPPLEWEVFAFFKEGSFFVRVNRAKGTTMISKEHGYLSAKDGATVRFGRVQIGTDGPDPIIIGEDLEALVRLHQQANEAICSALKKEGYVEKQQQRSQHRPHEAQEPMRKGKTARDHERRRNRKA